MLLPLPSSLSAASGVGVFYCGVAFWCFQGACRSQATKEVNQALFDRQAQHSTAGHITTFVQ
jgi:hypothetical protein